jgi:hypothetical protein
MSSFVHWSSARAAEVEVEEEGKDEEGKDEEGGSMCRCRARSTRRLSLGCSMAAASGLSRLSSACSSGPDMLDHSSRRGAGGGGKEEEEEEEEESDVEEEEDRGQGEGEGLAERDGSIGLQNSSDST